ncbi:multidrug effflux MFS transporter [Emcibacter sp. SYSU 3D8]|uniref:multidrug effflux MFS transporter n=1 Tax=Emcibacter sp. SYSU 3D8 TaxID=3133969 RepID=UPI0031FF0F11
MIKTGKSSGRWLTVQLVAVSALGPFGMHLIIPAIAPIKEYFDIPASTAALLVSATLGGIAISTLFFGLLADRFGRRPMLIVGVICFVIGSLMGTFGETAGMVIAGRVVQGIGGSAGIVISRAVIRDLHSHEKATSILAYLTMIVMIAPIMAPAFSGFLVHSFGWRMVFEVSGGLGFMVLTWLAFRFPETLKDPVPLPDFISLVRAYLSVLRSPAFVLYTLSGSFIMVSFFGMMSGVPYVAEEAWNIAPDQLGFYLGAGGLGMMASAFITARVAETFDHDTLLMIGFAVIGVGVTSSVVLFGVGINHPLCLFGPAVINGFGAGFVLPTSTSRALSASPRMTGTAAGMMTFLQFTFGTIAAQAQGAFDHSTVWPVLGFIVVGNGVSAIFAFWAIASRKRLSAS